MRKVAFLAVMIAGLSLTGCATLTKTQAERNATYSRVIDTDLRQLAYDWDYLWLAQRQYRLTPWYVR